MEIRDLTLAEAALVGEFYHKHWKNDHVLYRDRRLLLWLYHDSAYARSCGTGLTAKAAFEADRMIGIYIYIPFCLNLYGDRKRGCFLSAWWVDPENRNSPLGLRLLHELQFRSGFDACIAGINTAVSQRLYERMGWAAHRVVPRLIFVLDDVLLRDLINERGLRSSLFESAQHALPLQECLRSGSDTASFEIAEPASFDEFPRAEWDEFYWKQAAPDNFGAARETDFLQWRYGDSPVFRYRTFLARRSGSLVGIAITREERVRDSNVNLVRLIDLVGEPAAAGALLSSVIHAGRQIGAAFVDFFCANEKLAQQLKTLGFVDAREPASEQYWIPYLFQPIDHSRMSLSCAWWVKGMDMRAARSTTDIYLTKGDHEFDRPA
jgi:hypothetical protein